MDIEFKNNFRVHYGDTSSNEVEDQSDDKQDFYLYIKKIPSTTSLIHKKKILCNDNNFDYATYDGFFPKSLHPNIGIKGKEKANLSTYIKFNENNHFGYPLAMVERKYSHLKNPN